MYKAFVNEYQAKLIKMTSLWKWIASSRSMAQNNKLEKRRWNQITLNVTHFVVTVVNFMEEIRRKFAFKAIIVEGKLSSDVKVQWDFYLRLFCAEIASRFARNKIRFQNLVLFMLVHWFIIPIINTNGEIKTSLIYLIPCIRCIHWIQWKFCSI